MYKMTNRTALRYLAVTAVFNTFFSFIINTLVLQKDSVFDVFVVTQLIGLSIWGAVAIFLRFFSVKGVFQTVVSVVSAILAGILFGSALSYLYLWHKDASDVDRFMVRVFYYTFIFGLVFGIPLVYFFTSLHHIRESEKRFEQEKIRRLTMEKQAAMTSLRLLQAQIEPHFLFNTLSNVITLIDSDIEKAKQMLVDLNAYFRISLGRTRKEMITLGQELDLVRRYLNILKIRMGDRLAFEIRIDGALEEMPFPPLLIQPLVENSVKFGLEPNVNGGRITIACESRDDMLTIRVRDTGMSLEMSGDKAGIGIDNVTRRLETIYGRGASLTLKASTPKGVEATIEVPV